MKTVLAMAVVCAVAAPALADDETPIPVDTLTVRTQIGLNPTIVPDKAQVTTQLGYEGAGASSDARSVATAYVEATVLPQYHVSLFAAVLYGDEGAGDAHPSIGIAYQIADPRKSAIGARISTAYKGEGFSELDGEAETVLMLSKLHGADLGRLMLAFGFDPDFHDADGEWGLSYLHAMSSSFALGATGKLRYAFASNPDGGLRWDLFAGAAGELTIGHVRVEGLLGASSIDPTMTGVSVQTGGFGMASVGYDL
nr:hypothetical protein [Kofleriaceae bacterium]